MKILADTSTLSIRPLKFLQWSLLVDKVLTNTSPIMVSRKPSCKHTSAFWNTCFSALSPQRRCQEWQIRKNQASLYSQEKNPSSIISKLKCNSITTALKEGFCIKEPLLNDKPSYCWPLHYTYIVLETPKLLTKPSQITIDGLSLTLQSYYTFYC